MKGFEKGQAQEAVSDPHNTVAWEGTPPTAGGKEPLVSSVSEEGREGYRQALWSPLPLPLPLIHRACHTLSGFSVFP